jgi:hypothetical protein
MTQATSLYADSIRSEARPRLSVWGAVPWYVWCALAGITSVMVGVLWYISCTPPLDVTLFGHPRIWPSTCVGSCRVRHMAI